MKAGWCRGSAGLLVLLSAVRRCCWVGKGCRTAEVARSGVSLGLGPVIPLLRKRAAAPTTTFQICEPRATAAATAGCHLTRSSLGMASPEKGTGLLGWRPGRGAAAAGSQRLQRGRAAPWLPQVSALAHRYTLKANSCNCTRGHSYWATPCKMEYTHVLYRSGISASIGAALRGRLVPVHEAAAAGARPAALGSDTAAGAGSSSLAVVWGWSGHTERKTLSRELMRVAP